MSLSEIMATLADQYIVGITLCCLIVSGLYIAFSARLIITARAEGMNVCASAMIPVYQLILWFRKCLRKRKRIKMEVLAEMKAEEEKRKAGENEESEEIEL